MRIESLNVGQSRRERHSSNGFSPYFYLFSFFSQILYIQSNHSESILLEPWLAHGLRFAQDCSRNREFSWTLDPANSHAAGPMCVYVLLAYIHRRPQRGLIVHSVYMLYILLNI